MNHNFRRFFSNPLFLLCFAGFFVASCGTVPKPTSYFRNVITDSLTVSIPMAEESVLIVPGDQLSIQISSLNREEDNIFNAGAAQIQLPGEKAAFPGYNVGPDGDITVHKLGRVKAAGLTRGLLAENIQKQLLPYLKDPIVYIQFVNHKVTLMGEVKTPRVVNIPEDRMSLTDLLASGGDLAANGRCDNILIIRETGGKKLLHRVELVDANVFSSPWYWVRNNDIVYVSTDDERRTQEERRNRFAMIFSMTISLLSLIIIILNTILR